MVEDEMLNLIMIEGMLTDLGCETVTAAADIDRAIALIETQPFDVAMLDMNLDGVPSYRVADVLAARGIPYFFSTGYSTHGIAEGYADRPMLKKPFQLEDLAQMFERLLPDGAAAVK